MKRPGDPLSKNDQALLDQLTKEFAKYEGSMTQGMFDLHFRDHKFAPMFMQGWDGSDRIWGQIGGSDWGCWLDLLQYAVSAGLANQTGKAPNITYHLPAKP